MCAVAETCNRQCFCDLFWIFEIANKMPLQNSTSLSIIRYSELGYFNSSGNLCIFATMLLSYVYITLITTSNFKYTITTQSKPKEATVIVLNISQTIQQKTFLVYFENWILSRPLIEASQKRCRLDPGWTFSLQMLTLHFYAVRDCAKKRNNMILHTKELLHNTKLQMF